jgi:glycosyltransferase involved in cell wall biosynthesis
MLPELRTRPRLLRAIDLLPHTFREDVIRLCRLLFDTRPQAVHIWLDIPGAALACFIVGVPRFLIRSGSLSPDQWEYNEREIEIYVRPLRHTIRRLLERSNLVMVNNSTICSQSDQAWAASRDTDRFRVVRNAIDFDQLGPFYGCNNALRRELGIPEGAPVVGGGFRMVAVKRPEMWVEVSRLIAAACPAAHFVIFGDGPLRDTVCALAEEYGLADRFHLPGRVSNVGDWYRIMDVLLLTSSIEGTPNVIIEAQHFGVPSVCADVGGVSEIVVAGESAQLVSARSVEEYAEKTIWILRNKKWRDAAAVCGQNYVHRMFDITQIINQFVDVYGVADDSGQSSCLAAQRTHEST